MTDSIIPSGDVESAKEFIAEMQARIEERTAELREKVDRIRERAKEDERYEVDRAYAEVEPLRRQMEAVIQSMVTIEALKMPPPTIIRAIDR